MLMDRRALLLSLLLGGVGLAPLARADATADFLLAAALDNLREVDLQLQAGADPNRRDAHGNGALHLAAREEAARVLERLLEHPALQVDLRNAAGETPLMLAALRGRLDFVQRLVARGARIRQSGWTALHYACSGPDQGVVAAWLIGQGADLNAASPNGTTPLMMAAGYGGLSAAEVLLAAGADTAPRNEQGLSAMDFARRAGNERLEKMLAAARRP